MQALRQRAFSVSFRAFLLIILTALSPLFPRLLQVADCQRLADMPSFSLQKAAFYNAKHGLLEGERPPLARHSKYLLLAIAAFLPCR